MESSIMKFDGNRLKAVREGLGFSRDKFCKYMYSNGLDINHQTLYAWEINKRRPKADVLLNMSKILKIDSGVFFAKKQNITLFCSEQQKAV